MPYTTLSITIDDLPAETPYVRYTPLPHHGLIIVRNGITHGALVNAYVRNLPAGIRRRMFDVAGVADPVDEPELFRRMRKWWDPDTVVTAESIYRMERSATGFIRPWPHAWLL